MFWSKNKKKVYPSKPQFYSIKVGMRGCSLHGLVFVMGEIGHAHTNISISVNQISFLRSEFKIIRQCSNSISSIVDFIMLIKITVLSIASFILYDNVRFFFSISQLCMYNSEITVSFGEYMCVCIGYIDLVDDFRHSFL